ncbi:FMN-binding protein [Porticoccus sp. W117]|uniref:FMN-binding protein n=1 Tax=Porticoccus sp. W117 TaxID=3054777 RepID=UPI00259144E3|nr:FMN-binding protein [Porticoccus sp. W117]MDM3870487.1 FMN-binding protein [Porticoccus sp. W117]
MNRSHFIKAIILATGLLLPTLFAQAETFLTVDQARGIIWGDQQVKPAKVTLTKDQAKAIRKASKVRVRNLDINAWRTADGGWFILDQVIGKHENIDLAVGLNADGSVRGIEVLTYRETYGHEVRNPKWRAQFTNWKPGAKTPQGTSPDYLKLRRDIQNISGATLSCRHLTDGINRLTHTWELVLRHL